jgi:hypothetical protein
MCVKGVATYLAERGILPYVLLGKNGPTADVVSTKRDITNEEIRCEYTLNPSNAVGAEQKPGSLYIALPGGTFGQGCQIKITSSKSSCEFHARLVPRSELAGVISKATSQVIHIWTSGLKEDMSVTLLGIPGDKYTLNDKLIV